MSYATVHSCTLSGVQALPVTVEVHIAGGLPGMSIVGLPESAVRESKDRVKAAIQHIGLTFPQVKIIVNLAPADLPKRGGRFDLPIALGILQAKGLLPTDATDGLVVLGELGLTGLLRSVAGILPVSYAYADSSYALLIPELNVPEALRSARTRVHGVADLAQAVDQLRHRNRYALPPATGKILNDKQCVRSETLASQFGPESGSSSCVKKTAAPLDMAEVVGQHQARRALEIAAAGAHNLIMVGPPGTGKSMLASRLPTILPTMTELEAMESAAVCSTSHGGFDQTCWGVRPFRAPHHTASGVALVGGGANPMPGEASLAHNGVLFLDELPEFSRVVLDVLRQPMETGVITVSRAARRAEFPARFQLVAAMNPCPCGFFTDPQIECRCGVEQIIRYQSRVSGPFLDRIDLHLALHRETMAFGMPDVPNCAESSIAVRRRVELARNRQLGRQFSTNAALDPARLLVHARLTGDAWQLAKQASEQLNLSLRVQHRILRVARTIADLADRSAIRAEDLAEALSYRPAAVSHRLS